MTAHTTHPIAHLQTTIEHAERYPGDSDDPSSMYRLAERILESGQLLHIGQVVSATTGNHVYIGIVRAIVPGPYGDLVIWVDTRYRHDHGYPVPHAEGCEQTITVSADRVRAIGSPVAVAHTAHIAATEEHAERALAECTEASALSRRWLGILLDIAQQGDSLIPGSCVRLDIGWIETVSGILLRVDHPTGYGRLPSVVVVDHDGAQHTGPAFGCVLWTQLDEQAAQDDRQRR